MAYSDYRSLSRNLSQEDRFSLDSNGRFVVSVPDGGEGFILHTRLSISQLIDHLQPPIKLTRGGNLSTNQPSHPREKPFSFWLAQLIHYGRSFVFGKKDTQAALLRLLREGSLKVPGHLLELEKRLKKSTKRCEQRKRKDSDRTHMKSVSNFEEESDNTEKFTSVTAIKPTSESKNSRTGLSDHSHLVTEPEKSITDNGECVSDGKDHQITAGGNDGNSITACSDVEEVQTTSKQEVILISDDSTSSDYAREDSPSKNSENGDQEREEKGQDPEGSDQEQRYESLRSDVDLQSGQQNTSRPFYTPAAARTRPHKDLPIPIVESTTIPEMSTRTRKSTVTDPGVYSDSSYESRSTRSRRFDQTKPVKFDMGWMKPKGGLHSHVRKSLDDPSMDIISNRSAVRSFHPTNELFQSSFNTNLSLKIPRSGSAKILQLPIVIPGNDILDLDKTHKPVPISVKYQPRSPMSTSTALQKPPVNLHTPLIESKRVQKAEKAPVQTSLMRNLNIPTAVSRKAISALRSSLETTSVEKGSELPHSEKATNKSGPFSVRANHAAESSQVTQSILSTKKRKAEKFLARERKQRQSLVSPFSGDGYFNKRSKNASTIEHAEQHDFRTPRAEISLSDLQSDSRTASGRSHELLREKRMSTPLPAEKVHDFGKTTADEVVPASRGTPRTRRRRKPESKQMKHPNPDSRLGSKKGPGLFRLINL